MSKPATIPAPTAPGGTVPPMPNDVHNAYLFDAVNAASWVVVMGSPMLLFMQHLQATATVLAISASMAPVMVSLQIPAAQYVERVGYRKFALGGWSARSIFIIFMAVVAFLPESFDRTTRIVLMLFLALVFTTLRGIFSCGMLPWFTHIVPEERRGEFLAKDQFATASSVIVSLGFYGWILKDDQGGHAFGIVFALSAVAAFASLIFLKRIPDVPVEKIVVNPAPIPWLEMLFYPPFFRYLRYNVVVNMGLGISGVFWVRFFRTALHVSESSILFIACASTIVLAGTLFVIASLIDRVGNKPVLAISGVFFVVHFSGWACVAAGILPFNYLVLTVQTLTSGIGGALWNIANVRAIMSIVPAMGRPHFLALYTVTSSLTVGVVPLIWGPIMDGLDNWHVSWGMWQWNSYSVMYCTLAWTMVAGLACLRAITEPMKMTWDVFVRELLIETPSRAISRLISRPRSPGNG